MTVLLARLGYGGSALIALALVFAPNPAAAQAPDSAAVADSLAALDAATAPLPQGRRVQSWVSDRRGFTTGDLITVFVDERVVASATADDYARDDRRAGGGIGINSSRYSARIDADNQSDERGISSRDERFRTEISVRVIEMEGSTLKVEGRKRFQVDDHDQTVVLRGWVRPQDVSGTNVVDGWRIANLEFLYESNGELIKPEKGMLQKLLGIVF